jgi:hypothetical protein
MSFFILKESEQIMPKTQKTRFIVFNNYVYLYRVDHRIAYLR